MAKGTRITQLFGDISGDKAREFISNLYNLLNESNDPILVLLNTDGGCVEDAFAIYETLKYRYGCKYPSCQITILAMGVVKSAGVLILSGVTKRFRLSYRSTRFMIHHITQPDVPKNSDAEQLIRYAEDLEALRDLYVEAVCRDTKLNKQSLVRRMKGNLEHLYSATEAQQIGLISRIVTERPPQRNRSAGLVAPNAPALAPSITISKARNKS